MFTFSHPNLFIPPLLKVSYFRFLCYCQARAQLIGDGFDSSVELEVELETAEYDAVCESGNCDASCEFTADTRNLSLR